MVVPDPEASGGERAKVLDFGLAKLIEPEGAGDGLTSTGTILGTPAYMAPEQCKSARAADDKSDVYSLGIIMYEMLSSDIPFDAETDAELLSMHMFKSPPPLQKRAPGTSSALAAIVHRMLAKEPAERPSAAEVATELAALQSGQVSGSANAPVAANKHRSISDTETLNEGAALPAPAGKRAEGAEGPPRSALSLLLALLLCVSALTGIGVALWAWRQSLTAPTAPLLVHWSLASNPSDAEVLDPEGRVLGRTPTQVQHARGVGSLPLRLRLPSHREVTVELPLDRDAARNDVLPPSAVLADAAVPADSAAPAAAGSDAGPADAGAEVGDGAPPAAVVHDTPRPIGPRPIAP